MLSAAKLISSEETMLLLSQLRLGLSLELIDGIGFETINELSLIVQPAHLQRLSGRQMSPVERGEARAKLVREALSAGDEDASDTA